MSAEACTLVLEPTALAGHRDAIDHLIAGRLHHLTVRSLLAVDALAVLNARLDAGAAGFEPRPLYPPGSPMQAARQLGLMAAPTGVAPRGPDWEPYLLAAANFESACRRLFEGIGDAEAMVARVLSQLSGRSRVSVPAAGAEASYSLATIRSFPDGCGAGWHRDAYPELPAHSQLRRSADLGVQLSWYVVLLAPDAGGALDVCFGAQAAEGPPSDAIDAASEEADALGLQRFGARPGDLTLFVGSRYFHRVTASRCPVPRRTLGGFCAAGFDPDTFYFWG